MEKKPVDLLSLKMMQDREALLTKILIECSGDFFEFNITKNQMIEDSSIMINGEKLELNQILKYESPYKYTDFVQYSVKHVVEDYRETFLRFADLKNLEDIFYNGKQFISCTYRVYTNTGEEKIIERRGYIYKNPMTDDLCCITYSLDKTYVTEIINKNERIQKESEKDYLTQVYTRKYFEEFVKRYLEKEDAHGFFIIIDIDNFKNVNDTAGHDVGDKELSNISWLISNTFKNDIIGRLGGDEFAVFVSSVTDLKEISGMLEQLLESSYKIIPINKEALFSVSLSAGIAQYPEDAVNYTELYRKADNALYYSKENGKNCYTFYQYFQAIKEELKIHKKLKNSNRILVVEDAEINREILINLLENQYEVLEAVDGEQALEMIYQYQDELLAILLDLHMPNKDGYEVLKELRQQRITELIPVLVITAETDANVESRCFELGAFDFVSKPFNRDVVERRIRNSITVYANKERLEDQVVHKTKELKNALNKAQALSVKLRKTNDQIVDILGAMVEFRSVESGEHIQRVKDYTYLLGKAYQKLYPEEKLSNERLKTIVSASALHDIGKIAISDAILLKPGRLTKEEFEEMKTHTTKGVMLLQQIQHIWDSENSPYGYGEIAVNICRYHHERFDGRGYPDGLSGSNIPLCAQLVSVADVYDALVNERCYKSAFALEEAYRMIQAGECGVFSPKMMKAFEAARKSFEEIFDRKS